jgi:hypothetical protein
MIPSLLVKTNSRCSEKTKLFGSKALFLDTLHLFCTRSADASGHLTARHAIGPLADFKVRPSTSAIRLLDRQRTSTMAAHEHKTPTERPAEETSSQGSFVAGGQIAGSQLGSMGWLAILGGVLSGVLAFAVGELLYKRIPTELVPRDLMGNKIMMPSPETVKVAATKNAALAFSALGLCLAASLGVVGGFARRSTSSSVRGGLVGAVLGLAVGAGASLGLIPLAMEAQLDYPEHDLLLSLATHAAIWGLLGATAGLALATGFGEKRLLGSAFTAGLIGGVLGAVIFELIGATFFGLAETGKPISATWLTRLLARLLVTFGTAIAVVIVLPRDPGGRKTAHQTEAETTTPSAPLP